jgi:hypothetical protein
VFGNVVVGVTPSLSQINLSATNPSSSNLEGVSEFTVTYPSVPGKSALSITIAATDVTGLPAAVRQSSSFIDVVDASAALAAEKAGRAADKATADAALAAEKAARAADKATADAALAAEKAARAADKVAADKSIFDLSASVAALKQQVAQLKVLYNKLAVRFKQKTIK